MKTIFLFLMAFLVLNCYAQTRLNKEVSQEKIIRLDQPKPIVKDSACVMQVIPKNIVATVVAEKSELGKEIANADTTGLSAKADSIKQDLIKLEATVSKDSVYVISQDGTVLIDIKDLKTPTGKKLSDWLPYAIMFLGIVFLIFVSLFNPLKKWCANSQNQLVQRFFATTSKFINRVQIVSVTISGICVGILGLQSQMSLIPVEWISIIQTVAIVCVSIAGLAQITSNKPQHVD